MCVGTADGVVPAIEFAKATKGPVLLEFKVEMEEAVYPMVPTGASLHEMIRRPDRHSPAAEG
jgi:acetolactate synthase-1/2/3 large subunit